MNKTFPNSNSRGVALEGGRGGGVLKLQFDWYITLRHNDKKARQLFDVTHASCMSVMLHLIPFVSVYWSSLVPLHLVSGNELSRSIKHDSTTCIDMSFAIWHTN